MRSCEVCHLPGSCFFEKRFFCTPHWRAVYNLVLDAQKAATKDTIENYISYKTQQDIDDAANFFKEEYK